MNAERKVLMAIATLKNLLENAATHDYAVGAFNVHNLEFIQGVMEAATEMRSPVILAIAPVSIEYAGLETLVRLARFHAENASVPVAVHLDHGKDVDTVRRAILAGCSSVMFDGSSLPFQENVRRTREVVEAAHGAGIPVEGEIGSMGKFEDLSSGTRTPEDLRRCFTRPDEAKRFVEETGVDALAVAVGTVHRMPGQGAAIDFDRLEEIERSVSVPLVFHGCSGLNDDDYERASVRGVRKFNIGTKLKMEFLRGFLAASEQGEKDALKCLRAGTQSIREAAKERMQALKCCHRA
jgi:fructose-bisphosphate aldolase, class II